MITGLEEMQEKLTKLQSIGDRVSFSDMFPPQFISNHSRFGTIEELIDGSGFKVESKEDFEAISDTDWEEFITQNTDFESWEDMQHTAFNTLVQGVLES